jgi:D-alanyl-D-alanine carboxypeptidase
MLAISSLLLFSAVVLPAEDPAARLEAYLAPLCGQRAFMGVALVAVKGQPVFVKACGAANAEWDVASTPETRFRILSITKQFTAMAVLQLEAAGKLSVRDPACQYLDDCPDAWKPVTIHHLLTHTSGIPDFLGPLRTTAVSKAGPPLAATLGLVRALPLEFAPGSDWKYSNSNYAIAAAVVEKVAGRPLSTWLEEHVFDPLGMADTGREGSALVHRRASGYNREKDGLRNAYYSDPDRAIGAGDLYSTAADLLRWDQALYTDKLVPRAALDLMFTPARDGYGYGWCLRDKLGRRAIYHPGDGAGFSSAIFRFPDDHLTVIVLENLGDGIPAPKVGLDLASLALDRKIVTPADRKPVPVAPAILDRYTGEYQLDGGPSLIVRREGDGLVLQPPDAPVKFSLLAESASDFFLREIDLQLRFEENERGEIAMFVFQNGVDVKARRKR